MSGDGLGGDAGTLAVVLAEADASFDPNGTRTDLGKYETSVAYNTGCVANFLTRWYF